MSDIEAYRFERADRAHTEGLCALFESMGSGCYCNYWHFEGDKNAWLERCYLHPEQNRLALQQRLAAPELCGVVALSARTQALVGWLKVTRATAVPRLYDQRVYRRLPCFNASDAERSAVFAAACFVVAAEHRGRGVARGA